LKNTAGAGQGRKADPKEMDTLFHQMAWKGVADE